MRRHLLLYEPRLSALELVRQLAWRDCFIVIVGSGRVGDLLDCLALQGIDVHYRAMRSGCEPEARALVQDIATHLGRLDGVIRCAAPSMPRAGLPNANAIAPPLWLELATDSWLARNFVGLFEPYLQPVWCALLHEPISPQAKAAAELYAHYLRQAAPRLTVSAHAFNASAEQSLQMARRIVSAMALQAGSPNADGA